MYKMRNCLSPIPIQELFLPNHENTSSLRHLRQFKTPSISTVYHDTESVSFLGPKVSEILPDSFKKTNDTDTFKKTIKTWKLSNIPSKLCRIYVENIGFLLSLLNYNDKGHLKC